MKKNGGNRRVVLDVNVTIQDKKPGDEQIERFLEREAIGWFKFILSPEGIKVLQFVYGGNKTAKLKLVEKPE